MKNLICAIILICTSANLIAQTGKFKYGHSNTVKVTKGTKELREPWGGGFNNPQFNTMDVNMDGRDDLVILDRDGQTLKVFLRDSVITNDGYYLSYESTKYFPGDINDIFFLRDYNNDGKPDIFTSNSPYINNGNGLKVYKNISDTIPKFELITAHLPAMNGSNPGTVFVSPFDIPTIVDIDGDGDLDILAQAQISLSYQLFLNNSPTHDSLEFVYSTYCWGHFFQAFSGQVTLNWDCHKGPVQSPPSGARHGGSSITALDLNGDGLKDVIIGDPDRQNMIRLLNNGTADTAKMYATQYQFPNNADSVNITSFPAAYHLDINGDDRRDLIVAPNQYQGSRDTGSVWYYHNYGADSIPNFVLESKHFLTHDQIDVGTGAIPTFADISGDGKEDLLIANTGYFQNYDPNNFVTTYQSRISYYKNVGVDTLPKFQFITDDLANLSSLNLTRIAPSLGDLDGDGDNDLIFTETGGQMYYYENVAPIGSEGVFTPSTDTSFTNQNYGPNASPLLYDIDGDDKLDLLMGQNKGHVKLYMNQGTINQAIYTTTITDTLGGVFHYEPGYDNRMVPCIAPLNGDTNYLMVGGYDGFLHFYEGIDDNYLGDYSRVDQIRVSRGPIATTSVNINETDSFELFVGEQTGGVLALEMGKKFVPDVGIFETNNLPKSNLKIYPNPNNGTFTFQISHKLGSGLVNIHDLSGKNVYQANITVNHANQQFEVLPLHLKSGIYLITVQMKDEIFREKLIIQ